MQALACRSECAGFAKPDAGGWIRQCAARKNAHSLSEMPSEMKTEMSSIESSEMNQFAF